MTMLLAIMASPLPAFSAQVEHHLRNGTPEVVWRHIVSEIVLHYYKRFPNMGTQAAYAHIGEQMFRKYPAIEQQGHKPWVRDKH